MKINYIIIGAGPAGLAFAATLKKHGENSFVVLEKEKEAGGLCRSVTCDGAPLDSGGGHILDVRRKNVLDFVFSYMPKTEWNIYLRNSKIVTGNYMVDYPFEANIWQLPTDEQVLYLESIAKAALIQNGKPERFIDWIYWKLGDKIAAEYMIPYNQKIWSCDLNTLGTYWLEKLPNVSFRDTLTSCLEHKPYGTLPGHAQFFYPKKTGYGEVFLRIADTLRSHVHYNYLVHDLNIQNTSVNNEFTGTYIINTAPWHELAAHLPEELQKLIHKLQYTSVDIDYCAEDSGTDAHWTYYSNPELPYHRKIHRDNIIASAKGYWTETNVIRRVSFGNRHFENQYAYPLNILDKPELISTLLDTMKTHSVFGLGRWGEWEHYNSDVVMERGMNLAKSFLEGSIG
ncbi:amine oxidase [Spirochaetia bacterium]|nr:amine oxidase [Spirochaetia bacterium]